jgi:DnaJ-class molecular chaperone
VSSSSDELIYMPIECDTCSGIGESNGEACVRCDGTGELCGHCKEAMSACICFEEYTE